MIISTGEVWMLLFRDYESIFHLIPALRSQIFTVKDICCRFKISSKNYFAYMSNNSSQVLNHLGGK